MAAHAVRLIINDLPAIFDLPKLTSLPLLSNKIRDLDPVWREALDSGCRMEGAWKGEIDKPLRTLLQSFEEFYAWREAQSAKKRKIAADLLRRSDPGVIGLPQGIYEKRAERWLKLFGYFNAVAHRSTTSATQDGLALRRYRRRWTGERTIAWLDNFRRLVIRWDLPPSHWCNPAGLYSTPATARIYG